MAEIFANLQKNGIRKKVLHGGEGSFTEYEEGTKLYFHYKTTKCDVERMVVDDSHQHEKPMELILGKKFKLEVWEACIRTMKPKEVSEFLVDAEHVTQYPVVSKQLREIFGKAKKGPEQEHHCCGMMGFAQQGTGHPDLDELVKAPQPLIFTIDVLKVERPGSFEETWTLSDDERIAKLPKLNFVRLTYLLKVERPGSFEKETWTLSDDERIAKLPKLRESGNALFKEKKYAEASVCYGEAIGIIETLTMKEKPGEPECERLEDTKLPFLLNFSQCKLSLGDYYAVIEHTSTVLKRDSVNVKALYRRAKAHVGAWNPSEAKTDFARVVELDPSLTTAVNKELKQLEETQKQKDLTDKQKLKGLFS